MPSNFRYNPYTDISTTTQHTETHIIPHTSPYIITLGEVPQKDSPSTMSIKEVIIPMTDPITYGATFSEVAATPSTGEYFPDYNTGANGDKTWNTGKILFSANDAGKVVEITYTATGTLASVKANHFIPWWTDRGDGSDGIFHPTADVTISGEKNYTYVYIPEGVTVTVAPYALFKVQGAFINYGKITATGQGGRGGKGGYTLLVTKEYTGRGYKYYVARFNGEAGISGAASNGGAGGGNPSTGGSVAKYNGTPLTAEGDKMLANISTRGAAVGSGGSGGGSINTGGTDYIYASSGGNGGGAIAIVATNFYNKGTIEANGEKGIDSNSYVLGAGGGGGGGSITVVAEVIKNIGTFSVNGGAGGVANKTSGAWGQDRSFLKGAEGTNGIIILKELGAD